MAQITAAMVKQLRDDTQLPMMECKKALAECDGDMEVAKQKLREAGKKFMGKRQDRSTDEGRIGTYTSVADKVGSIIELQCESAPVSTHEDFVQLANDLAQQLATGPGAKTAEELWSQPSPSQSGKTLEEQRDDVQNRIREVFRLARLERVDAACGGFVHMAKIGVLLEVEGGTDELAKEVCLHIAAMNPQAMTKEDMDAALVEQERELQIERARKEGKPENIIEKMIEGRMRNFYAEHVLEEQPFVKDEKQTVGKVAQSGGMKLKKFIRWQLGESSGDEKSDATTAA
ncbi:MAG: translation elongation factor Ts [Candidatus Hydrogenedentes bacterium]|nr:translation elongation factor Ts [Candidatus Hydrogenedentota bacterium]